MARKRSSIFIAPAVASVALLAMAAAAPAASAASGRLAARTGHATARLARAAGPAAAAQTRLAGLVPGIAGPGTMAPAITGDDATLIGDSCTSLTFCNAVGFFFSGSIWPGLSESWDGQQWARQNVPALPARSFVVNPFEVSCSADGTCMLVGDHASRTGLPAMLAESLNNGTWSITQWSDPAGARLGWLGDVSCTGPTFCMAVGAYSKTTFAHEHVFSERWTGTSWTRLNTPAPAKSLWSELAGLSCFSDTKCVAVGNFENAAKHVLSFAAVWNGQRWSLTRTPNVTGKKQSIFQGASCPSATNCMAVGIALGPGQRQFAEKWSGGRWRLTALPRRTNSGLTGVSCPTVSMCMASGFSGRAALTELRTGGSWRALATASLSGTRRAAALEHVSCISVTHCVAVGIRYNPTVRFSNRTLAEVWDGHGWTVQTTVNP
jgi:hypothetical protein